MSYEYVYAADLVRVHGAYLPMNTPQILNCLSGFFAAKPSCWAHWNSLGKAFGDYGNMSFLMSFFSSFFVRNNYEVINKISPIYILLLGRSTQKRRYCTVTPILDLSDCYMSLICPELPFKKKSYTEGNQDHPHHSLAAISFFCFCSPNSIHTSKLTLVYVKRHE